MNAWLAAHLSWMVCVLLALWAPPLLFAMGVDLGLITEAQSGFPSITDVPVLTSAVQLLLMAVALPDLSRQRPRGWRLLAAAFVAWLAHGAWMMQSRVRLTGIGSLVAPESLITAGSLAMAAAILFAVRGHFLEGRSRQTSEPGRSRVAPGSPAHVP